MDNLKGIIMDVDGTILPTLLRQEKWFKFYAEQSRVTWNFQNFQDFCDSYNAQLASLSGVQGFYDLLQLPCDMSDRAHPVWDAYNQFNLENSTGLFPGMGEALEAIGEMKKDGLKIGLNTTNTLQAISKDLSIYFGMFDCIITADTVEAQHPGRSQELMKPNPFTLSLALHYLGCSGNECMHVGDTLTDLKASHGVVGPTDVASQNLFTVGCLYGYEGEGLRKGTVHEGKMVHFDKLIESPTELPDLVRKYL